MKILLIDNFDSFVFNLYQYFGELGVDCIVKRNNEIGIEEIKKINLDAIILSPGPGTPENKRDFGVCKEVLEELKGQIPILGVCLGHQGIVHHFGGKIVKNTPMHGKTSEIEHDQKGLFEGLDNPLKVMRYHSLVAEKESIPECLEITASSKDDEQVMAVKHKEYPIYGLQFHPESIMSENGKKILENFLRCIK